MNCLDRIYEKLQSNNYLEIAENLGKRTGAVATGGEFYTVFASFLDEIEQEHSYIFLLIQPEYDEFKDEYQKQYGRSFN